MSLVDIYYVELCLIDFTLPFQELISAKDAAATNEEQLSAELSTVSFMTTFGMHDPCSPPKNAPYTLY